MAIAGYREQFMAGASAMLDGREYDRKHSSAWKAGYRMAAERAAVGETAPKQEG